MCDEFSLRAGMVVDAVVNLEYIKKHTFRNKIYLQTATKCKIQQKDLSVMYYFHLLSGLVECLILIGRALKSAVNYERIMTAPLYNSPLPNQRLRAAAAFRLSCVNLVPYPTFLPCKQTHSVIYNHTLP